MALNVRPSSYSILQLNTWSPKSWAVIALPSGAIARDEADRLIIRMTREDAQLRASAMTHALRIAEGAVRPAAVDRNVYA